MLQRYNDKNTQQKRAQTTNRRTCTNDPLLTCTDEPRTKPYPTLPYPTLLTLLTRTLSGKTLNIHGTPEANGTTSSREESRGRKGFRSSFSVNVFVLIHPFFFPLKFWTVPCHPYGVGPTAVLNFDLQDLTSSIFIAISFTPTFRPSAWPIPAHSDDRTQQSPNLPCLRCFRSLFNSSTHSMNPLLMFFVLDIFLYFPLCFRFLPPSSLGEGAFPLSKKNAETNWRRKKLHKEAGRPAMRRLRVPGPGLVCFITLHVCT